MDKCIRDLEKECIGSAKAAILEKRIEALEEGAEKSSKFRETFYEWQKSQIELNTRIEENVKYTREDVKKLVQWQENQREKPSKRWDAVICAAIGVVVGFVLKSMGIF